MLIVRDEAVAGGGGAVLRELERRRVLVRRDHLGQDALGGPLGAGIADRKRRYRGRAVLTLYRRHRQPGQLVEHVGGCGESIEEVSAGRVESDARNLERVFSGSPMGRDGGPGR
jgi:hypothetical protein